MNHPDNALIMTLKAEKLNIEYSAIIDAETCDVCRALEGKMAANARELPTAPNPDCTNPRGCRCMIVEILD